MGKINDMVKDVHETAVQHGWWDKPPEVWNIDRIVSQ